MTPLGEVSMANVIATIPAGVLTASCWPATSTPSSIGTDSSAPTTAPRRRRRFLELGRVLKSRQNELTIELLFLDGEEARRPEWRGTDNTYGSRHYVQAAQKSGSLKSLKALVLLDMIGDRDLLIKRDANSTPWLVDVIWSAAARLGHGSTFSNQLTTIEDDHIPFLSRRRRRGRHHRPREPDVAHASGRPRPRQRQKPPGRRRRRGRAIPEIEKRILNAR